MVHESQQNNLIIKGKRINLFMEIVLTHKPIRDSCKNIVIGFKMLTYVTKF